MKWSKLLLSSPVSIPLVPNNLPFDHFSWVARGSAGNHTTVCPYGWLLQKMFPLGRASVGSIPHIPWGEDKSWKPVLRLLSVARCGDHGEAICAPQPLVLSSGWFKLRVLKAPTCSHEVSTWQGCIIYLALVTPLSPSCRQCLRSVWGVGSIQEALSLEVQVCCPKPSSQSTKAWQGATSLLDHTSQTAMGISLWAASPRLTSSRKSRGAE